MIEILVLESNSDFCLGLRQVYKNHPNIHIAGEASNGAELSMFLAGTPADLVLTGIARDDDMGVVDVVRKISKEYPAMKILAVASGDSERLVYTLMKNGMNGFIGKREVSRHRLEKAIRQVAAGKEYIGKSVYYPVDSSQ